MLIWGIGDVESGSSSRPGHVSKGHFWSLMLWNFSRKFKLHLFRNISSISWSEILHLNLNYFYIHSTTTFFSITTPKILTRNNKSQEKQNHFRGVYHRRNLIPLNYHKSSLSFGFFLIKTLQTFGENRCWHST